MKRFVVLIVIVVISCQCATQFLKKQDADEWVNSLSNEKLLEEYMNYSDRSVEVEIELGSLRLQQLKDPNVYKAASIALVEDRMEKIKKTRNKLRVELISRGMKY